MASRTTRCFAIAFLLVCLSSVDVDASLRRSVHIGDGSRVEVLRTSDLRSAYLIRAGVVRYDANEMSPQGLRRQLQRHFDVVIALLIASTPEHIELALDRLEASRHESWSSAQRDSWRRQLMESRRLQIARLVAYRHRGQFPLNEGHASHPVPIFVDEHGTACAVGHLMRLSGLEDKVAGIRNANNLVHIPDVANGPVVAWTLTSGITLEEAALIQPMYGPVLLPKPDRALEVLGREASFEFGDLRYSNFQLFASDDPAAPNVNIPVGHQACSWSGCGSTFPVIWEYDLREVTQLVPGPIWPIRYVEQFALEQDPPLLNSFPRMVVQFDVEVTAPNLRIASLPNGGSLLTSSYFDGNQFRLFINHARDRIWIDQVHNPGPYCDYVFCTSRELSSADTITLENTEDPPSRALNFPLTDRMTVVTEMYFPPDQEYRGQFINFLLVAVPEPSAMIVAIAAIGWCAVVPWRKRLA